MFTGIAGLLIMAVGTAEAQRRQAAAASDIPAKAAPADSASNTVKREPLIAAIEPAVLRTELARPFAEGRQTVIVPAREEVVGLSHYSKEEFAAAGLDWEDFLKKAEAAATRHLISLKPEIVKDKKGNVSHGILKSTRPLVSGMVLSPRFLPLFQEQFGERIVVLMPDHFTLYLFPRHFSDFQTFGPRVLEEFNAAVWPCSREAFEVTREGVKCLGSFDTGEGAEPRPPVPPVRGQAERK